MSSVRSGNSLQEDSLHGDSLGDWPEQQLRGNRLEGYRYTSEKFFEQEFEQMWTRVWLLLGRESEMPEPGDWQREEVGPESFLMVRQEDSGIKAFYNVCQHRGNRLKAGFADTMN